MGEAESLRTLRSFHSIKAVERTSPKLRPCARSCLGGAEARGPSSEFMASDWTVVIRRYGNCVIQSPTLVIVSCRGEGEWPLRYDKASIEARATFSSFGCSAKAKYMAENAEIPPVTGARPSVHGVTSY
jgi:hypothetical protein